ncbi:hypothetical protein [Brevibacillus borstelensis]|uniref:hypothetical protein n=1 Tax=Brevibacillus borstelensis TaxID=45462 RepID=UPI001134CCE0|nr:hypothetical protein [Brevibacillus borstelensis]MCM3471016.1 hypothetical protein [Brevibacillus borstelensis]MCM3591225.1 hypothetical protein [Brevibacillus borstelensis]TGV30398.1 hypothetical protein EN829_037040 [Mesorhizobium sp. M00.F.Ca.ET.186.01.1.1]
MNKVVDLDNWKASKMEIPKAVKNLVLEAFGDDSFEIEDFDLDRIWIRRNDEEYTIRTWDFTESGVRWTLFKMIDHGDGTGHGEELKEGLFVPKNMTDKGESDMNKPNFVEAVLNLLGERVVNHHDYSHEDVEITMEVKFELDSLSDIMTFIEQGLEAKGFSPSDIKFQFGDGDWMTVSLQKAW